ncbi:helix-turn-helix transcriptional regulator [Xanthomonas medicagonis]|uniref:helix-turn-helix transcriptional regulator n=1 Tax=Xanthomonas medicagonis TaxID=3160841 RepID=UPI0035114FDB
MNSEPNSGLASGRHPLRFLRIREVLARTGLPKSTLYDRIRVGSFPKPVPLGGTLSAWVESEVEDWMAARIAERESSV